MTPLPMLLAAAAAAVSAQPNIVFILADDLGWNDVSLHGSEQIGTPDIDGFCKEGLVMKKYYAQSVCSPTRATLMTGRHVIHTGVYYPLDRGSAERLNTSFKLLPEYLQDLGYKTHMIGKWHLGQNTLASLPTARGFETYLGYWAGAEDYITKQTVGAYDFANGTETAYSYNGTHSAYTFTDEALRILRAKVEGGKPVDPFFMYLSYQNVHWPLEAPQQYLDMYTNVPNQQRQEVCALARMLNDAFANVTRYIESTPQLADNTIVIFSSDNGGPTNEYENTWSSNYPLRGGKNGIWEGGFRVPACIKGPGVVKGSMDELFHVSDWLPTFIEAAGGVPPVLSKGDGVSGWKALTGEGASQRDWLLYEAHPDDTTEHGNAYQKNHMKIIKTGSVNPSEELGWAPPPGEDPTTTPYTVHCPPPPASPPVCSDHFCLFNLTSDPCEHTDISASNPDLVASLVNELQVFKNAAVPPAPPEGCKPIINSEGAWRPCDAP